MVDDRATSSIPFGIRISSFESESREAMPINNAVVAIATQSLIAKIAIIAAMTIFKEARCNSRLKNGRMRIGQASVRALNWVGAIDIDWPWPELSEAPRCDGFCRRCECLRPIAPGPWGAVPSAVSTVVS